MHGYQQRKEQHNRNRTKNSVRAQYGTKVENNTACKCSPLPTWSKYPYSFSAFFFCKGKPMATATYLKMGPMKLHQMSDVDTNSAEMHLTAPTTLVMLSPLLLGFRYSNSKPSLPLWKRGLIKIRWRQQIKWSQLNGLCCMHACISWSQFGQRRMILKWWKASERLK